MMVQRTSHDLNVTRELLRHKGFGVVQVYAHVLDTESDDAYKKAFED